MIEMPEYVRAGIDDQVRAALSEDVGDGDITAMLIDADATAHGQIISREPAVFCGRQWVDAVFEQLGGQVSTQWHVEDGQEVTADQLLCSLHGNTRQMLTGERTALNFLQTLMGTATSARAFADATRGSHITVLDTRKTIPGLRTAQKYAVLCGGCQNHRIGLFDAFLIKENHVAACGSISRAIERARELAPDRKIIVEVETLAELDEALSMAPDQIMLDNFTPEMVAEALARGGNSALEVSGNLTLDDARKLPADRPLYLSSGALTKHCQAIDLSMRLETD
jgi:nicotinate-nucleotide pyrophosphorylase (carboxylating)